MAIIDGTNGNDDFWFLNGGSTTGDDTIYGHGGKDTIDGFLGDDTIFGGSGDDVISGHWHNDTLKGGGGADVINGGPDIDTASYGDSPAGVTVSLISDIAGGGDATGDDLNSIENLVGSIHADTLIGDDGVNVLNGQGGNDELKGWGGADTLDGENGNDFLNGGAGADDMIGGLGNDIYIVDNAGDDVSDAVGQGNDTVRTSVSWTMTAGASIETLATTSETGTAAINLTGNSNGNHLIGNNGPNFLNGGGGVDHMTGNGGDDIYVVDNASDWVTESGGGGDDAVSTSVSWTLTLGADVETLHASVWSSTEPLNLTGNETGNVVWGNAGNNVLNGREGNDELIGVNGEDSFLFNTELDAMFNVDVITGFDANDTIQLDDDIFSSGLGLGNIANGELVIGAAALDANDRIIYNSATGVLSYDSDGNGATAAIHFATLSTGLTLTNLDFLVVA